MQIYLSMLCQTRNNFIKSLEKKIWNFLKKKDLKKNVFWKNRVRWKFSAVFGLEKIALDRILHAV